MARYLLGGPNQFQNTPLTQKYSKIIQHYLESLSQKVFGMVKLFNSQKSGRIFFSIGNF